MFRLLTQFHMCCCIEILASWFSQTHKHTDRVNAVCLSQSIFYIVHKSFNESDFCIYRSFPCCRFPSNIFYLSLENINAQVENEIRHARNINCQSDRKYANERNINTRVKYKPEFTRNINDRSGHDIYKYFY